MSWSVPWGLHWMAMKLHEKKVFRANRVFDVAYESYIRSPEWMAKAKAFKEAHPHCGVCNRDFKKRQGHLQTHHLTYKRLGREIPSDLKNLCDLHHPKGAYSLKEINRDRRKYLRRKYLPYLYPWNWLYWTLKLFWEVFVQNH